METICLTISVRSNLIQVGHIPQDLVSMCSYVLTKLFITDEPCRFFSMTNANNILSLVLEKHVVDELIEWAKKLNIPFHLGNEKPSESERSAPNAIQFSPILWRAIQIDVTGLENMTGAAIMHTIAKPLADNGVTIFYVSGFVADYILVPQDKLNTTLDIFRTKYNVVIDFESTEDSDYVQRDLESNKPKLEIVEKEDCVKGFKYELNVLPLRLALSGTEWDVMPKTRLIKELFYSIPPPPIVMVAVDDYISLLCGEKAFGRIFPHGTLNEGGRNNYGSQDYTRYSGLFRPIRVGSGEAIGFDEVGVAATVSAAMKKECCVLFYTSTYNTDYVFIEDKDWLNIAEHLKSQELEVAVASPAGDEDV